MNLINICQDKSYHQRREARKAYEFVASCTMVAVGLIAAFGISVLIQFLGA